MVNNGVPINPGGSPQYEEIPPHDPLIKAFWEADIFLPGELEVLVTTSIRRWASAKDTHRGEGPHSIARRDA